jgi:DNA-directed RNA polymerase specialized sigma24 family protein
MASPESSFDFELYLQRLQAGDSQAIEEFVAQYEPYIRRAIRFRIRDAALMAAADSVDVCQSVLGGFLLKLAAGNYVLNSETDMRGLLLSIARKKFGMLLRRENAAKRCRSRMRSLEDMPEFAGKAASPAAPVELAELIGRVQQLLSQEEWEILQMRRRGDTWSAIETRLGIAAMVLKKRLSRAIRRVADELGIDL